MRLFARQQSGTHSPLLRHTYGQLRGILHDPKNNIAAYGVANEYKLHILGHVSSHKSYFCAVFDHSDHRCPQFLEHLALEEIYEHALMNK